jgi:transposase-like protein
VLFSVSVSEAEYPHVIEGIMILQALHCPHGHGTDSVRHGQTRQGKPRDRCRTQRWAGRTFLLDYRDRGQAPAVQEPSSDMAMHARGMRDTARVLPVSTNTVMTALQNRHRPSTKSSMR